jgi:hypothetical protein
MNKTLLGGILLSLVAQAPAMAQGNEAQPVDELYERGQRELPPRWQPLGKSHAGAVFLHQDIRKDESGRLAVWLHRDLPAVEYFEKEKPYLSTRERVLVDCKTARVGTTDLSYYDQRFAGGAMVGTNRTKNPDMTDVVPDSIEDRLVRIACAPKPRNGAAPKKKAKAPKPAAE